MKTTKVILTILALAATTAVVSAADVPDAWGKICQKCHGPDGKGQTKIGQKLDIKDLTDPKVQATFTDDQAFNALKNGLKDSDDKSRMKPLEGVSDTDMKALVAYVRTLKGK